jgi:hypothetical protein
MKKILLMTVLGFGVMFAQAQEPKKSCCKSKKECSTASKKECKDGKKACCKDKKEGASNAGKQQNDKASTK